jgi:hypothetical protein
LSALSKHELAALEAAAARRGFTAIDLGIACTASCEFRMTPLRSHNVIGMVRGRERPDEFVIYTAHWEPGMPSIRCSRSPAPLPCSTWMRSSRSDAWTA